MLAHSNHNQINKQITACLGNQKKQKAKQDFTILLVEDHPLVQTSMLWMLKDHFNFDVDLVTSGEEAVKLFSQHYDLVIMDIGLPGIDGIEAACQIREFFNDTVTPIIAHTAHGNDTMRSLCFWAGMDAYLEKGCSPEEFKACIDELLTEKEEV